jgi:hypothetical protein
LRGGQQFGGTHGGGIVKTIKDVDAKVGGMREICGGEAGLKFAAVLLFRECKCYAINLEGRVLGIGEGQHLGQVPKEIADWF